MTINQGVNNQRVNNQGVNNQEVNNQEVNNQKGGKVIASGGFGCIFSPPLKCQGSSIRKTETISKLMTIKHANDEYKQIQKFKDILKVIPNFGNYFLLDNFELCKPDKLTKDDLIKFSKKCKPLKKKGITTKNINNNLNKIMTINMPNGGIDIEQFIEQYLFNEFTSSNIIRLNNSLIDLLVNGIIPMNKLNVYHCDIKDSNILVKVLETELVTRLIDWGLSFQHNNNKKSMPKQLYRRPFQYNVPFSSVLFNKNFVELYSEFLTLYPNPDYYQIREFVVNYIFIWNDIRGPGHLSSINDIIKKLTIKDLPAIKKYKIKEHFIEYDFTYYYIVEYLSKILEKYTNNGQLDIMIYFNEIFLKNIDIWGFVMVYISLYESLFKDYDNLNESQMQFIVKLKYIVIHFLYECPTEIINVASLVEELTNLNKVIENFDTSVDSKRLEYNVEVEGEGGTIREKYKLIKNTKIKKENKKTYKNKKNMKPKTKKLTTRKRR
jgi:hypothetical protein